MTTVSLFSYCLHVSVFQSETINKTLVLLVELDVSLQLLRYKDVEDVMDQFSNRTLD